MSRAAQEMQRIADEMKKNRQRPTKKGRQAVDHELEDVTEAAPAQQEPAQAAAPAAAAEENQTMAKAKKAKKAKSASAIRSAKWRANQKKKAAGAPQDTDRASVKALGDKLADTRTVFITCSVGLAKQAFEMLRVHTAEMLRLNAGTESEAQWKAQDTQLQKIVARLG